MTVHPGPSPFQTPDGVALDRRKFRDPYVTADGSPRAHVELRALRTLWFNTGTLCNIACKTCYIESSPRNDALSYLGAAEVRAYLDEVATLRLGAREIGFTGGEPFMNPEIAPMLGMALERGHSVLVLTNAMQPMRRRKADLLDLRERHGRALTLRVSLDHHTEAAHDAERRPGAWAMGLAGLDWLARHGFSIAVAGRGLPGESEDDARAGFERLFASHGLPIDAGDPQQLVLFPEMDATRDVPEITQACWGLLRRSPDAMMCASSRMVVKRRGADRPVVVACTLIPYEPGFELGTTLAAAGASVSLNHPHCARFCVLGGASCSVG